MDLTNSSDNIHVQIAGSVSGQLAIGNNIVQIGEIHGGIVNFISPDKKPTFTHKPRPTYVRPHTFPGLLNRTEELGTTVGALRVSESVSIHGQNGLGKTALLRFLAYNSPGDNFPDGIVYIPARGKTVEDILQEIFDSFYESDCLAKPSVAQLHQFLQSVCALILLDDVALNYEQVSELVNCTPQCIFIFASTERCLWGEGRCLQLEGLPSQEALTLIERELGHTLNGEERVNAGAFCEKVRGHPLHLIQGAALVRRGKTFQEIGDRFGESEDALVKTVLAELNDSQRSVLSLLAASGNFPISLHHLAALTQAQSIDTQLNTLLDLHLLQANSPVYNLPGSLALSLGRITDLSARENRIHEYFVQWIKQNPSMQDIQDVMNLLLSILERAIRDSRWKDVILLGRGVENALILGKRWQVWSQVLGWILKAAQALGDQAIRAWALHQIGTRHLCLGNFEPAKQSLTKALEIRHALGDEAGAAVTQHNLGLILAPPAPPRDTPRSKPGPTPKAGGSSVLKIILSLVGITMVAFAGVILWNLIRPPQPTPTSIVIPPTAFTITYTYTPTNTPTDMPSATPTNTLTDTPTNTPSPTQTFTVTPSPTNTPDLVSPPSPRIVMPREYVEVGCPAITHNKVFLEWEIPYDPSGISNFKINMQTSSNNEFYKDFETFQGVEGTAIKYDVSSILDQTSVCTSFGLAYFRWQIYAQDNAGNQSLAADWAYFSLSNRDTVAPPKPMINGPKDNMNILCPSSQVLFTWTEPIDSSGISNYYVEIESFYYGSTTRAFYWYFALERGRPEEFDFTYEFNKCSYNSYRWRVRARDNSGNLGDWSDWAYFNQVVNVP